MSGLNIKPTRSGFIAHDRATDGFHLTYLKEDHSLHATWPQIGEREHICKGLEGIILGHEIGTGKLSGLEARLGKRLLP